MPRIHVLTPHIANQIAAGEVVERPSSVVKELVENAVDAHATAITVEIENGGIDRIRITDNGCGIADEDCETAFLRHATSKISSSADLSHIATLGFRGEALASIAAVSRTTLTTRTADDEMGTTIRVEAGEIREHKRTGGTLGTSIDVQGLFYNVPARLKFLKSPRGESGAIGDYMARLILSLPEISFQFVSNGKTIYQTNGDGSLKNALVSVYGISIAPHLCPVTFDDGYLKIDGYVGTPEISRPNRTGQSFFLNGRIIRSAALSSAVGRAFDTRLLIGRYPFAAIHMRIALAEVDVNVHPAKLEVRFADESRVCRSVCVACSEALVRGYVPEAIETPTASAGAHVSEAFTEVPPSSLEPEQIRSVPRVELRSGTVEPSYTVREASAAGIPSNGTDWHIPRFQMPSKPVQQTLSWNEKAGEEAPFSAPYRIIGAAFDTYWFVQQGDDVYLIDQHAAHERLLYDALVEKRTPVVSQALFLPEEITLLPSDYVLFCERMQDLEAFGFLFTDCGDNHITLLSVPQINGIPLKEKYLLDVLHEVDTQRGTLMQTACKHAIKGGESITREEIAVLLERLKEDESLLTCPHGRPIAVRMSKLTIEKMFKRVP